MKKWLWYLAVVAAVALLSGNSKSSTDVGKLQPVQVVRISSAGGQVIIETDTGNFGIGDTLKNAFENLKKTSSAQVFLDTADYLIIGKNCKELLPALMGYFRPACAVCLEQGAPDMELVGTFLEYHKPKLTLMHYQAGERKLPVLQTREGRMELVS